VGVDQSLCLKRTRQPGSAAFRFRRAPLAPGITAETGCSKEKIRSFWGIYGAMQASSHLRQRNACGSIIRAENFE
jgi:hypothetical protein